MKNYVFATWVGILFSTILLVSCKRDVLINPELNPDTRKLLNLEGNNVLDPTAPGSFNVVTQNYKIPVNENSPQYTSSNNGTTFFPYQEVVTPGPLVLLLHGNGTGGHGNYKKLCEHLASHGFYVASIAWNSGDYKNEAKAEGIKNHFIKHINFLYNDIASPLKGKITNNMVLMGHSRGGGAVVSYAAQLESIKNVQAIIALAPSPADMDMQEKFSLNTATSFLGIYGSSDVDVFGGMDYDVNVKRSCFKFFDDAGYDWGNANFTKDMIFIKGLNHNTFCDNSTDLLSEQVVDVPRRNMILGYVNAFLQLHINKKEGYNQYFKFQTKMPSTDPTIKVSQQHTDGDKLVLANFENQNADKYTHYSGSISYPGTTVDAMVDKAALLDAASFHGSKTMAIAWQQKANKPAPVIVFPFSNKTDVSSYKYLNIRAGLIPFDFNDLNKGQSFYIQLQDDNGAQSSYVPVTIPASFYPTGLKSYMQSFLLPLHQFKNIDMKKLKSVSLNFINKNYPQGRIMIDNIEFFK